MRTRNVWARDCLLTTVMFSVVALPGAAGAAPGPPEPPPDPPPLAGQALLVLAPDRPTPAVGERLHLTASLFAAGGEIGRQAVWLRLQDGTTASVKITAHRKHARHESHRTAT